MTFESALESGNIDWIARIPKSDLHNHAPRGGNIADIEKWAGVKIDRLNTKFRSLGDMQSWYEQHIKCYCQGVEGYEVRIRAAFRQAQRDGVKKLVLTFGLGEELPYGSLKNFSHRIMELKNESALEIEMIPEIAIGSDSDLNKVYPICEEYFDYGFFKSIDINGPEMAQPISAYRPLYRLAKSKGLRLRAHVGEFGSADSVFRTAEVLELTGIQHGIAAAGSKKTMK